ncbi:SDR family oxidoreductase [Rhizobium populisoli]|uniref:SDR family oxidoreductase n=1 Tax=Rhizobium populisoli TaxID=2859785 RepID=UPI001FE5F4C4|nr:SDR family oxidoreductase [Rhizobium populisoli]
MRVMIFGCGYSGQAIAGCFRAEGARVSGTARTAEKVAELEARGITGFVFDGSEFGEELAAELREVTHLVQSIPPMKLKSAQPPHPASATLGHPLPEGRGGNSELTASSSSKTDKRNGDGAALPFSPGGEGARRADEGAPRSETREGDPLLKLIAGRLKILCPKLEWIGYLSTVGVYGDHGGGWVTEETPGSPILGRSIERVDTEDAWAIEAEAAGVPVAALRLSGIYGPGRNAFVNLARGTARRIIKRDQVFNRIRVEDIGGAALFLGTRRMGGIYNVTDDEPGSPQDVIVEAARLMGVEPPAELDFDTADMTPMARSFYSANKRVSNAKIVAAGFRFRFPNYRMSLAELWSEERWRG